MTPLVGLVLASTWSLSVHRDDRAAACPDQERLRRNIAERLGRDPFLDAGPSETRLKDEHRVLMVRFSGEERGHTAVVALQDKGGAESGKRELSSTSTDCAELAGAVVLAAAIVIDPLVMTHSTPIDAGTENDHRSSAGLQPEVKPALPPPPLVESPGPIVVLRAQPGAAPVRQPLPQKPSTPGANSIFVGLGGGASLFQVSTAAAKAELSAFWEHHSSSLGVRLAFTSPGVTPVGVGTVAAYLVDGGIHGCVRWGVVGACAQGSIGTLEASSTGFPNPTSRGTLYGSVGLAALLDVPIGALFRIRSFLFGVAQPRVHIAVGGTDVFSTSTFAFGITLSFHVKVWGDTLP